MVKPQSRRPIQLCIYCGVIATQRDHLNPRRRKIFLGLVNSYTNHIKTVPSCRQCNSTLRGCLDSNVYDRASYLVDKYTEKQNIDDERMHWLRAIALREKC